MLKLLNDPKANHTTYSIGGFVFRKTNKKQSNNDLSYEGSFQIAEALNMNSY